MNSRTILRILAAIMVSGLVSTGAFADCSNYPDQHRSIASQIKNCTAELFSEARHPEQKARIFKTMGELYLFDNKIDDAIAAFTRAIGTMPTYGAAYASRGDAYSKMGKIDLAKADYAQADANSRPDADELSERCGLRARRGYPLDLALADCNAALKEDPDNWHYLNARCIANFRLGKYDDAIADSNAALAQWRQEYVALYIRGLAKLREGDLQGGNEDIESAKHFAPDIEEVFAGFGITR